ncbi:recombinase family protein [Planosporangium sp. 12N6]|uniref:recombinase family protein n=1 Tax=Planosporangium spinosum TaxID=3402278 RepID=UPI003CF5D692
MTAVLIGYARCTTDKQDVEANRQILLALHVAANRIYRDRTYSGTTRARPGPGQTRAAVRTGDTFMVPKLDRLVCSTPTPGRSAIRSSPAASACSWERWSTSRPTRWPGCSSTSWPPPPSSKSTCYGCAPAKAWRSPGQGQAKRPRAEAVPAEAGAPGPAARRR